MTKGTEEATSREKRCQLDCDWTKWKMSKIAPDFADCKNDSLRVYKGEN